MDTLRIESRVIMFTDVHDFSILMTTLGQNQHQFLQDMYERLGDIIVSYFGEIMNYFGDGMLCVFPSDTERTTIECAARLRTAFTQLLDERGISHKSELEVGIGSGEIGIGMVGHKSFRTKDLSGEEVNRTALIGHHKGIGMTENVYEKIRDTLKTQALPDQEVKWQKEPLRFWEVVVEE